MNSINAHTIADEHAAEVTHIESQAFAAVSAKRAFTPSAYQQKFFDWVADGSGSATLKAVAGSGKSTSIVRALPYIPSSDQVLILAFNAPIAKEMKGKIAALGVELGRTFSNVEASTFHARGFKSLCRHWGRDVKVEVDDGKVRKILKDRLSEREYELYGDFVAKLVGYAKGVGIGITGLGAKAEDADAWRDIIATQDMWLDDEDATEERAIDVAQKALRVSNHKAKEERWIDFNDQLYLPLLWNLRMYRHHWVIVDEAQDTNPVRREFARRCLNRPGGIHTARAVFVGDPKQSIYAFTGASSNAMEIIAAEFKTVELPLTVSYRCPKAVGELARELVPYFEVAPGAIEGEVRDDLKLADALQLLGPDDMILCRKTAPLIDLAFQLIAGGRGCRVIGKDVGAGLVNLIKKQKARGVENLLDKLAAHLAKETEKFVRAMQEGKAEALSDRVASIRVVAEAIPESERTVPAVIARIENLFGNDDANAKLLSLSTGHKAKGREAPRVLIYGPELLPSKMAKTEEAIQQEENLDYVMRTRATLALYRVAIPEGRAK